MSNIFLTFFKISPKVVGLTLMATAGTLGVGTSSALANSQPAQSELIPSQAHFEEILNEEGATNSAPLKLSELSETFQAQSLPAADNVGSPTDSTVNLPLTSVNQLSVEEETLEDNSMAQVTSVSQLSDVQPTDWAFQALQNLVERYGCIAGYPDGTFRGNRAMTRYEFAAGLNACLEAITSVIGGGGISREELDVINRLMEEFSAELATLRGRIDVLEARTAELEANQFSTTTKLVGEVAFQGADVIGDGGPAVPVLQEKIRLQLVTSFTGRDFLYTRITTGNLGNSFADELGTNEGRFAYDGIGDNVWQLDRLHYVFPVGKKLTATVMASLGGHHFYADTFNQGLEAGGGANGALSRFGERNPIYRIGLGGQGAGLRYQLAKSLEISAGYLARGGDDPQAGMFANNYSAMGQIVFKPSNKFKLGFTYVHSYDVEANRRFNFGGTGTNFGNLNLTSIGVPNTPVTANSYGVEAMLNLSPRFSIRGWAGLTKARLIGLGDSDIWNYSLIFAFPDLGKKGNLAAIIVGAEPYLKDLDVPNDPDFSDDIPWHIEALYKYQVTDNISITPGVIWLLAPNQNQDNNDAVIGTVRTTFTF